LLSLFLALGALAQSGDATVEGRVLNKLTGAGIAKITVFLRSNTFPQAIYNADTDNPVSVFLGSQDVTGTEFILNAGSPPLRVVHRDGADTLRAFMEQPQQATLVILPRMPDSFHIVRAAVCGPDGKCEMKHVFPGDYYAFIFRGTRSSYDFFNGSADLTRPEFLQAVFSDATLVHLSERAVVEIKLPVVNWPE
jgi:hypothetical protein